MFCNLCEMKHEMREFITKPSCFALVQMRFNMTKKISHALVVLAVDLSDFSLSCFREMQSLRYHVRALAK